MAPRFRSFLLAAFACIGAASIAPAQTQFNANQRTEIEAIIKDYLLKNPEVLRDAMAELERRQKVEEELARAKAVSEHAALIYNSPRQAVIGNPNGKVTLVEFFDYNCGYCKRALEDMMTLMKADPNLKVVLKEFPVLGPGSQEAARVAVAVRMQDKTGKKYLDFHQKLLGSRGQADKARAMTAAKEAGLDIAGFELVSSEHSHDSAAKAVALVKAGKAEALMKGSLHTDELMAAVVARETGIRTARRISHCFIMDVPGHADALIITDAAVNIAPTLEEKVDILQNAIDLARALGAPEVRVAILSAMETVNPKVPSTVEAAALCKMADRGQITGALIDGPLALDNAISPDAAAIKHIVSPVAGRANVLLVPDLEAGNMLAKSLSFLAGADAAGIVLGARVPIVLTSRADSLLTRLASCAVAVAVAAARRASTVKIVG